MNALKMWTDLFTELGIAWAAIPSNPHAVSLDGLAGAPVFRCVQDQQELNTLHTKARSKAAEMGRILLLGLPFYHPNALIKLPGDITLPSCRAYGGHIGSSFSLSGHQIENTFLLELKKEVTRVISGGTKTKTPLCEWLLKLTVGSWHYGVPSSKEQLDSLLGLVSQDPNLLGHVRTRQLSYGRGCGDALLLPTESVMLPSNTLDQKVHQKDFRFISMEREFAQIKPQRMRIHSVIANKFMNVLAESCPTYATELGCGAGVGASVFGPSNTRTTTPVAPVRGPVVTQSSQKVHT